ncbi:phosphopantetheine-binding protein [Streptomyces sp. NPDC012888]|uniref:phosphopantetheine-binding protein n=1 Tax=Streptomyces sp. NPDC012888 TaxID=3364855 RepID=UPI00369B86DF
MTYDRPAPSARRAAPAGAPADVLTDLIGVLGDILRVKPEKIDPEQSFQSLGLDSLLMVEFVAVVNTRYGLQVRATDLYDHPTPASFAREVRRAAQGAAPAPARATAPVPVPTTVPAPAPAPAGPGGATGIAEVLREQLAAILCCDPWEIDTTAAFNVLGVDSIVGAEFIAVVNRVFGLQERSVLLYEHPSLAAMAAYVAARTGAADPQPQPRPAGGTTLPSGGLDVLLDAVRDDRLTVDEALVLLGRLG